MRLKEIFGLDQMVFIEWIALEKRMKNSMAQTFFLTRPE